MKKLAFVDTTGAVLLDPLVSLWNSFVSILPGLIAAIVILVIGYLIAYIIGHAIKVLLEKAGLDTQLAKAKLTKAIGHTHASAITGEIVKWYIFIIFLQAAVDVLNLGTLSVLLRDFANWLPNVIAAILVLLVGLLVAHFVSIKIEEHTKVKGIKTVSGFVRAILIFIFAVIALNQVGIDVSILTNGFLILVAGVALALGLAFGLGSKKEAETVVKKMKKYF